MLLNALFALQICGKDLDCPNFRNEIIKHSFVYKNERCYVRCVNVWLICL